MKWWKGVILRNTTLITGKVVERENRLWTFPEGACSSFLYRQIEQVMLSGVKKIKWKNVACLVVCQKKAAEVIYCVLILMLTLEEVHEEYAAHHGIWVPTQHSFWDWENYGKIFIESADRRTYRIHNDFYPAKPNDILYNAVAFPLRVRTLPDSRNSYVPQGPSHVEFFVSHNWLFIWSNMYVQVAVL
jgi:hypothetical protein